METGEWKARHMWKRFRTNLNSELETADFADFADLRSRNLRNLQLPLIFGFWAKSHMPGPVYRIPPPHWLVPLDRVPAKGASRGLPLAPAIPGRR